ncbi:MAG TPA: ATP-binding protein [Caulobacteraceae bacterium]|nr:ATP-binding protein [Caulobacteraceae bacterium]
MRKTHHPPFQARVASVAIVTTVAVLGAACLTFMLQQWSVAREEAGLSYQTLAKVTAASAAPALASGDSVSASRTLAAAAGKAGMADARLLDRSGRIMAEYPAGGPAVHGPFLTTREPVFLDARQVGEIVIQARPPALGRMLPRFLALTFALFFGASGAALIVAQGLARRVSAPMERLSNAMAEVAASGKFTPVAETAEDDVFHRLTESFNDLLSQLGANHAELHRAMTELVAARDAADAANVAKSRFLANMSHEIRTPLNGVLAMAEVMSRGELEPSQRERLAVVRQSGEQLLAVLNDVLDLSKIEAGKLELAIADFTLETVAQSVKDGFAAIAASKNLEFDISVAEEARGLWRGDGERLRQILTNLVSNALKFTREGAVSALFETADSGGLRLVVKDSGIGIPEEKMPFLFEKFTQADNSTTRQYGGTGLGLAICRELAQLMGGSISAVSQQDKGSTFFVELPFERGATEGSGVEAVTPAPEQTTSERRIRVLAAEDNLVNQTVLRAIVEPMDLELSIVADGQAAVEAWRAGGFDLILMDIQMPVMDGIAATRLIRAAEEAEGRQKTPIIALTANALVHQVEEYMAAGMDGHVAKPIEIAKLYHALNRALAPAADAKAA